MKDNADMIYLQIVLGRSGRPLEFDRSDNLLAITPHVSYQGAYVKARRILQIACPSMWIRFIVFSGSEMSFARKDARGSCGRPNRRRRPHRPQETLRVHLEPKPHCYV